MGSFLYFWPEKKGDRVRVEDLTKEFKGALAYLIPAPGIHPEQVSTTAGPEGAGSGMYFAYAGIGRKSPGMSHLVSQCKKWYDIIGTDVRFSWDPSDPPGPKDLVRPEIIAGYKVELGDGCMWEIPFIRDVDGSTKLKRPLVWDGNDFSPGEINKSDAFLYEGVKAVWEKSEVQGENAKISINDDSKLAALGITRDHRASPSEISALELLDTDNYPDVIMAMMGLSVIEQLKKNGESIGQSTMPGEGA